MADYYKAPHYFHRVIIIDIHQHRGITQHCKIIKNTFTIVLCELRMEHHDYDKAIVIFHLT